MKTCIIIEDQLHSAQVLESHIKNRIDLKLLKIFENPIDALNYLEEVNVDLIFVDIQMPQLNGLDLIEIVVRKKGILAPKFIITTGYNQYAVSGFEQGASDYILKPVGLKRFNLAVDRLFINQNALRPVQSAVNFFFADHNSKKIKIMFSDIIYLEANNNYVNIYCDGLKLMYHSTMNAMQEMLGIENFLRVHKSYIVSIDYIESIQGNEIFVIHNKSSVPIPISRTYKELINAKLNL